MGEHHYPARVRRGGLYLTALFMIVPLIASIAMLGVTEPFPAVVLVAALIVVLIVYASGFKLRYELDDNELRFRQGIFPAWRIPILGITRVVPKKSSCDADCLVIEAGSQLRVVFAPDTEEFMRQLAVRAPHLRKYGAELRGAIGDDYGIA